MNNVFNPYDAVSVTIDEKTNVLLGYSVYKNKFEYKGDIISEDSAINNSISNAKNFNSNSEVIGKRLTVIKPKDRTLDNSSDSLMLAYQIDFEDIVIFIDASNGNYIGNTTKKNKKEAQSFSDEGLWNAGYSGNMAAGGLKQMDYNVTKNLKAYTFKNGNVDQLKNFIETGDGGKAMFVNCHGNPYSLANTRNNWSLNIDQIKNPRVFRFVFLNSCKGAYYDNWARKFGIKPGEWGAFLGWTDNVYTIDSVLFPERFWKYADGRRPIYRAMQMAKDEMPSTYTTNAGGGGATGTPGEEGYIPSGTHFVSQKPLPIRFIGSKDTDASGRIY
ncbi:MAG: hypothetical protein RR561_05200 [Peptostreptococcus sp.]|uniref:hypothetical protein n=1 Tax=Peptostreptococcus sp. TaxID=1262 RepID=UPI002FC82687